MRICLITPAHLSANPRLVKEADALVEAGHSVTVVSATYQAWSREADPAFYDRPWRKIPAIAFGPDAPMARRIAQSFRNKGARLLFAGGARGPHIIIAACHPAAPDLARAAPPADLYIGHNLAGLPAAAWAAQRNGGRYAFDAEDFHSGQHPEAPQGLDPVLDLAVERRWLRGCAWMTAASPGIAEAYAEIYGIALPTVVLNLFPLAQAPAAATPRGSAAPAPSIYWFSQTIGPDRGLEAALRAIALAASKPHLYLRGAPARGFADRLKVLAAEAGVTERLHILPPAPPEEMARLAALYDLGLAGETGHTHNRRIALTNKLFTYLLAGLPILASDVEAHRAFAPEIGEAARLYATDDPASLAAAIDSFLTDPVRLARARAAAFALGQRRFNWDVEKVKLIACVEQAFAA